MVGNTVNTTPSTSLSGASVLVAGATGGLGRALTTELANRGALLTLVARSADRLATVGEPGLRHVADLRSPDACLAAIAAAKHHAGKLDVVVNAVGVVAFGTVTDHSTDTIEELFLTNTFLPIFLAQAAVPELSEGGTIVNISGVIAEQNLAGMALYGASKAALRSFDEGFAREARRFKVRVIDARPPHTETGLASRPIAGQAPRMPVGLSPHDVAVTICDAIENDTADLPSTAFTPS
jgi:cyclic-di-GMP-binding biofilm dispersal mediator protein